MVRQNAFSDGISMLFDIIEEKHYVIDEQISQDLWNKYLMVDLFYTAP